MVSQLQYAHQEAKKFVEDIRNVVGADSHIGLVLYVLYPIAFTEFYQDYHATVLRRAESNYHDPIKIDSIPETPLIFSPPACTDEVRKVGQYTAPAVKFGESRPPPGIHHLPWKQSWNYGWQGKPRGDQESRRPRV